MEVTLAVAADYANTTADGKLNISGVFTEVTPPAPLPFTLPQMYLVVSYAVDSAEFNRAFPLHIGLRRQGGSGEIFSLDGIMRTPATHGAPGPAILNQIIGLSNVQFEEEGPHELYISVDDQELGRVSLHVYDGAQGEERSVG